MLLIYLSCAWVAGIVIGSILDVPAVTLSLGIMPLIVLPFFRGYKKTIVLICLCTLILIGGAIRFQPSVQIVDSHSL